MLLSLKAFLVFWFSLRRIGDVAHQFNLFIETFMNLMHPSALDLPVWWPYLPKGTFTKRNESMTILEVIRISDETICSVTGPWNVQRKSSKSLPDCT